MKKTPSKKYILILIYLIPISILGTILYYNFLPDNYAETFIIKAGSNNDTRGEFSIKPSQHLSSSKTNDDGTTYRTINGPINIVFYPKAIYKNADIKISTTGENIFINSENLEYRGNVETDSELWNYVWNFTEKIPTQWVNATGSAFLFENCTFFDGTTKMSIPNSSNDFETGPFSIYLEWNPRKPIAKQQIIGHYNWEISQEKDKVTFTVGKMNDNSNNFYSVDFPVDDNFFFNKHSLFATYTPSEKDDGHIRLFVDGYSTNQISLGNKSILPDYGTSDLSIGKSEHGNSEYFSGCIYKVQFANSIISLFPTEGTLKNISFQKNPKKIFTIYPKTSTGKIDEIKLEIQENKKQ